jgi:hypothetical protein
VLIVVSSCRIFFILLLRAQAQRDRTSSSSAWPASFETTGILEYREVEIYRIFCVVVEPEERGDAKALIAVTFFQD